MSWIDDDDTELLTRLRAAMKDPTKRALIQQEMQQAATDPLGGTLTKVGSAMQKSTTPAGSAAAGIGAGLGLGLAGLMKLRQRNKPAQPGATNPTKPIAAPEIEPNLNSPAGTNNALQPLPPSPDINPGTLAGGASTLKMGVDRLGNNVSSTDGGVTWKDDHGNAASGTIYNQTDIGGNGMKRGGRVRRFAEGGSQDEPPEAPKRAVLLRRPIPVLHTTIVIAHKPSDDEKSSKLEKSGKEKSSKLEKSGKPVKKARGGAIKAKVPEGPPAPFRKGGHVQVPRGSGRAIKGRRFSGIY